MYISGIIAAFLIALFISLLFSLGFKHRGPWGAVWLFFIVIFLVVWAGQLWIFPIALIMPNTTWVFLLFLGMIFALALAAPDNIKKSSDEQSSEVSSFTATVGVFFWLLLIFLIIAIISGYIHLLY